VKVRPDPFDIRGRVVAMIGATGLLGTEYVHELAARGARVIIGDIDVDRCRALADQVQEETGAECPAFPIDLYDEASIAAFYRASVSACGRIDAVVNNSQVKPDGFYDAFDVYRKDVLMRVLEGNTVGLTLSCQHACQAFLRQGGGGVIVNVGSIYGLVGADQRIYDGVANLYNPGERFLSPVAYAVSKAGVVQVTRYLAAYMRETGIRVNCLVPGGVFDAHDERFVQQYASRTLLGRMADRTEYNGALVFLLSSASSYMTGATLVVDGGWTAV
jgi:NAD(P)-dependent dehydrogenase (short-subunit alcohol dehydrogenase family)